MHGSNVGLVQVWNGSVAVFPFHVRIECDQVGLCSGDPVAVLIAVVGVPVEGKVHVRVFSYVREVYVCGFLHALCFILPPYLFCSYSVSVCTCTHCVACTCVYMVMDAYSVMYI